MSTPLAVYTIAHERGIDISRHLSADETAEVRGLVAELRRAPVSPTPTPRARGQRAKPNEVRVVIAGVDVGAIPRLKPAHAREAKEMADKAYPMLYLFENSARDLIEAVLEARHGRDWWDTVVPTAVTKTAEKHRAHEAKDPWHGARGKRPIDYVFLSDLWSIIKHNWSDFKELFPTQAWVESLITSDMNVSRRPIAHMNPIAADDITNIEAAFRKWVKQLQAKRDKLP